MRLEAHTMAVYLLAMGLNAKLLPSKQTSAMLPSAHDTAGKMSCAGLIRVMLALGKKTPFSVKLTIGKSVWSQWIPITSPSFRVACFPIKFL